MKISSIAKISIGHREGLRAGDDIIEINGHGISDAIDLRFHQADAELDICIHRDGERRLVRIRKEPDQDLGVTLAGPRYRRCDNRCVFCFVDQMPPGLRRPLYFKDEDFRLSFLHGSYLTLTTLSDSDLARIREQRLSPLFVSVHATEPRLRCRMLGNKRAGDIMVRMKKLVDAGIKLHAQIVLCPGINDGMHLERTISDLIGLHPGIESIAVVPVGLTKHRKGLRKLNPVTAEYAKQLLGTYGGFQQNLRKRFNKTLLYFADEFYLKSNLDIPKSIWYDDYAQIDDGVGMVRKLWNDFKDTVEKLPSTLCKQKRIMVITSVLGERAILPIVNRIRRIDNTTIVVRAIQNRLFGESVTVTGLLAGGDILDQTPDRNDFNLVALPGNLLNDDDLFIDDTSLAAFRRSCRPATVSIGLAELLRRLKRWAR